MATDALGVLQAGTTRTSALNSTGYDLTVGTPRRGLFARIDYSAGSVSSGAGTALFQIEHSTDDSTYHLLSSGRRDQLALGTTGAVEGQIYIPFETASRYVRLALSTISGTGATVTYSGHVVLGRPG